MLGRQVWLCFVALSLREHQFKSVSCPAAPYRCWCFSVTALAVQLEHLKLLQAHADVTEAKLNQLYNGEAEDQLLQPLNSSCFTMVLSSGQTDGLTFLLLYLSERVGLRVAERLSGSGAGWLCHLLCGSGCATSCCLSAFGMDLASMRAVPWQHPHGSEPGW